jgi:photosystem II stability/assembly factor-like uncharacterized protein
MARPFLFLFILLSGWTLSLSAQPKAGAEKKAPGHYLDSIDIQLGWRSVGPAFTSGRISDFAVHPQNRGIYYVASASGGVWKTQNAGTTYEPIFDGQGSYSIGCLAMAPSNPNIIWVGTGENNNQRSVAYGDGVYKSLDGGKSWEHMGLKQSEHIGRILIHPADPDIVYVAAIGPLWSPGGDRGVFKTTDGGKTWTQILQKDGKSLLDEHTGVTDLLMDPRDPRVLYAAAFQRRRHVFTYVGGGPGSTLYKSTDGGETWTKAAKGFPEGDLGRIGLAISPADPEYLYAIVEATADKGGFYRSTDRAASWQRMSGHVTSGNYYCEIVAHPTEPHTVISMDVFNQITRDGGKTFQRLGEEFKHVDNHAHWIDPLQPDYHLSGNDGGIYESFDAGKTWLFKANLPVTQFYKVEVDNSLPFYHIHGGTQDNYSIGGPSRSRFTHGISNDQWYVTSLGDGFESQIDPDNPDIIYAQAQYGVLVRFDRASGEMTSIQPQPREGEDAYRWNWDAPLAISHHQGTRLYFCANKVFRSDDRGNSWSVISEDLTRQIDRNTLPVMGRIQSIDAVAKNQSTSEYGNIVAFAESPLNPDLLYAGTDDGLIQVTEDGGRTWRRIASFPGVPDTTYVNMLIASRHQEGVVYAAFNNHKRGDFKPYLLRSRDKGRSWQAIQANLPERGSVYSIAEDHVDADLLFTGTEFSCFFSPDGGAYWKKMARGLPTIAVRDMAIQRRENDLVLGTFGRGFYVLDDYSPLRHLRKSDLPEKGAILPVKDGLLFNESSPLGYATGKGFQGHAFFTAPNPPVGVSFPYMLRGKPKSRKERRQEWEKKQLAANQPIRYPTYEELEAESREEPPYLLFTIRNTDGEIVRQLRAEPRAGLQRLHWDGRYPSSAAVSLTPRERMPWASPDGGGLALPGNYTVSMSLIMDGTSEQLGDAQPFTLRTLGGVTLPAADRPALDAYIRRAGEIERVWAGATRMLQESEEILRHFRPALLASRASTEPFMADLQDIEAQIRALRTAFYGDRTAVSLDMPRQPALVSRIYSMSYDIWNSSSAPTGTQQEQMRLVGLQLETLLPRLTDLADRRIPEFQRRLEKAGVPYTPGRRPEWSR